MKKFLALCFLIAVISLSLTACVVTDPTRFMYDNEELYEVGDGVTDAKIERVEIDWIDGNIKVAYHSLDNIRIAEKSDDKLDDDMVMRYRVVGTTLKIKYCASGSWSFDNIEKDLTLYLPKGLILSELNIDTVSDVVTLTELNILDLTVESTSASVMLDNCMVSNEIELETVSGNLHIAADKINKLKIETVSGRMNISADSIEELEIETTSGNSIIDCNSIGTMDIDSVSGDVELKLPEDSAFTLRYSSVSGKLTSALDFTKEDKAYHINGGGRGYKISTTSGDVSIAKKK
jgi:DUF4097 and DUF4098 domain-containing protein YvlB